MERGRVKSFGGGQGTIEPDETGKPDVFFLSTVVEGSKTPAVGAAVEYKLYQSGGEPEAKRVVII